VDLRGLGQRGLLTPPKYFNSKIQKVAYTANEISFTVDFQSLSLAKQFFALESTRFNLRACIFKKISGGMPPDPLVGTYFVF